MTWLPTRVSSVVRRDLGTVESSDYHPAGRRFHAVIGKYPVESYVRSRGRQQLRGRPLPLRHRSCSARCGVPYASLSALRRYTKSYFVNDLVGKLAQEREAADLEQRCALARRPGHVLAADLSLPCRPGSRGTSVHDRSDAGPPTARRAATCGWRTRGERPAPHQIRPGGTFTVDVFRADKRTRVSVTDDSGPTEPVAAEAGEWDGSGRGLRTVALPADSWGWHGNVTGRSVTAVFATEFDHDGLLDVSGRGLVIVDAIMACRQHTTSLCMRSSPSRSSSSPLPSSPRSGRPYGDRPDPAPTAADIVVRIPRVPDDQSLTPREASEHLGIALTTLSRWARGGRLPAAYTLGGHRRFRLADIQTLRTEREGARRQWRNGRAAPCGCTSRAGQSGRSPSISTAATA